MVFTWYSVVGVRLWQPARRDLRHVVQPPQLLLSVHPSKVDPSGQREDARDLKVQVHVERGDLHAEAKKAQRIEVGQV